MEIIITAVVGDIEEQDLDYITYGYIHNGHINDFDYDKTINEVFDELVSSNDYNYVRISNVEIKLGYTYPVYEQK